MSGFEAVARLKQLLRTMEQDLGLDKLGAVQRDILYAATLLGQANDVIATEDMRQHDLLVGVPRSTFFKALKEVVSAGYLAHIEGVQRSSYILSKVTGQSS